MKKDLLVATNNQGKLREYREMLEPLGFSVHTPKELGIVSDPEETGRNYQENAYIKAHALRAVSPYPVLADDSGLEIKALGDFPGLHSARYAASLGGDYRLVCAALLEKLAKARDRTASFHCTICFLEETDSKPLYFEGVCPGYITHEYKGSHGFGYDPIFHCVDPEMDFGLATEEEKNAVSHRGRALRQLLAYLSSEERK
jgi:XTP/dITP diphosphohydrolase